MLLGQGDALRRLPAAGIAAGRKAEQPGGCQILGKAAYSSWLKVNFLALC